MTLSGKKKSHKIYLYLLVLIKANTRTTNSTWGLPKHGKRKDERYRESHEKIMKEKENASKYGSMVE